MRSALQIAAGMAIAALGVYLLLQSGASSSEETLRGTVTSVEIIERQDGRSFDLRQHQVRFTDPETGEQRVVESARYRQQAPAIGTQVDVFIDTQSNEARVAGPQSRRNGWIAIAFGAALMVLSLPAVLKDLSS